MSPGFRSEHVPGSVTVTLRTACRVNAMRGPGESCGETSSCGSSKMEAGGARGQLKDAPRDRTADAEAAPSRSSAGAFRPEVTERAFLSHQRTDRERDGTIAEEIRQK